jgi:hypothetical protein
MVIGRAVRPLDAKVGPAKPAVAAGVTASLTLTDATKAADCGPGECNC